ncbi:alpha beta-hydrolase [Coniophora puteana RWD-64-598 SS2]|uniref:GPI inositol-deacylase n=1 Tax=Coniophora puteana (strain RWD-64-598) TaxID=741705 RepID=A0A5M3N6N6_CONPW|nr:alpha beta-hydrolase [Coniophora puteana RWD-64-598 SS2]EIW86887.1 alpha beta-hydrolase [Coniophora puteana RWD-64-598 SS2]
MSRRTNYPIVRWAVSRPDHSNNSSNTNSPRHSQFPSLDSDHDPPPSSAPPSPNQHLLDDALTDTILPALPPQARISDNTMHSARPLSRPPNLLTNLARATLPTASLSPPPHSTSIRPATSSSSLRGYASADTSPTSRSTALPPVHVHTQPPTRSSIDTLRSVRDRPASFHSAAGPAAGTSFSWSWWNDNVAPLLADEDRAEAAQDTLSKKYRAPKNPVVFCHGLMGFDSVTIGPSIAPIEVTHWRGIKEALEENGVEVYMARVPATSSPVERAKVLEKAVSKVFPGRAVHLIGHSMGGLDCRYLTTHLTQRSFSVLSVTTIATPHRGSSFADHFLATIGMHRLPSFLALIDWLPNGIGGGDGAAFKCLTVAAMAKFNEETPDVEGVRYFSWGAVYDPGLIDTWKWSHSVILEKEGPNDGLVSVESAKWGTYLGTLQHVNHLDLVGWINAARYKWAEMRGKEIQFRPATFYLGIVDYLAWEVERQGRSDDAVPANSDADAADGDGVVGPVDGAGDPIGRSDSDTSDAVRTRMEESLEGVPHSSSPAAEPQEASREPTPESAQTVKGARPPVRTSPLSPPVQPPSS